MDGLFGLPRASMADVQVFKANANFGASSYQIWRKRPGASKVGIYLVGSGGSGGNGVVGAVSTAAGGGGGGSAGQTYVEIPAFLLPDVLYVAVPSGGVTMSGQQATVTIDPTSSASAIVARASGGAIGSNATGASGGTGGPAGTVSTLAISPLGFGAATYLAGQSGANGGGVAAGLSISYPATGLRVSGGAGGAGVGAAGSVGAAGGAITGTGPLPVIPGGLGGATATTPPEPGSSNYAFIGSFGVLYGGSGGGATHGTATGAGRVGSRGGDGAYGCGGGGGGGAITGSTQGIGGRGGDGLVIITQW